MNTIDGNAVVFTVFTTKGFGIDIVCIDGQFRFENLSAIRDRYCVLPAIILIGIAIDAKTIGSWRDIVWRTTAFINRLSNRDRTISVDDLRVVRCGLDSANREKQQMG
ncbi:hypothetical protein JS84_23085 [Vibrio vulnificus]|nr:hypothetical protein JS83_22365 [Vibrio vulnificus]KFK62258.1 hypothetical protein JS84_23085 [Vibrio vulnificus]KFK67567.1 hypothetical protein JS85_19120 [Vibrio vulnificus]